MNPVQALGYLPLLVALVSCSRQDGPAAERPQASAPTEVDTAMIAGEIRRLSEEHAQAAAKKDTARVGTIYAADVLYLPQNDSLGRGAELVRRLWRRVVQMPELTLRYQPADITVSGSGDLAVERGTIASTLNGKPDDVGHYIYVWQLRDGKWEVTDYIWNTRPPGKESR